MLKIGARNARPIFSTNGSSSKYGHLRRAHFRHFTIRTAVVDRR